MNTPRRLGRGLGGLIQSTVEPTADEVRTSDELAVAEIRPNPYQPRRVFDDAALEELRASIAEHGLLQPIVVRRSSAGGFEVVAGERRLRACKALGLAKIRAVVRDVDDAGMQTLALVENVQRADLNPIEKARAVKAMMTAQSLTQDAVAARIGKDRATVANLVRLLELPDDVRALVEAGKLSAGQARTLLQLASESRRSEVAAMAVAKDWSVREIERFVRLTPGAKQKTSGGTKDPFLRDIESRLRRALSTGARVRARGKGGTIEIDYADPIQLDALLERLGAM